MLLSTGHRWRLASHCTLGPASWSRIRCSKYCSHVAVDKIDCRILESPHADQIVGFLDGTVPVFDSFDFDFDIGNWPECSLAPCEPDCRFAGLQGTVFLQQQHCTGPAEHCSPRLVAGTDWPGTAACCTEQVAQERTVSAEAALAAGVPLAVAAQAAQPDASVAALVVVSFDASVAGTARFAVALEGHAHVEEKDALPAGAAHLAVAVAGLFRESKAAAVVAQMSVQLDTALPGNQQLVVADHRLVVAAGSIVADRSELNLIVSRQIL